MEKPGLRMAFLMNSIIQTIGCYKLSGTACCALQAGIGLKCT
jgi:hypothetical protein